MDAVVALPCGNYAVPLHCEKKKLATFPFEKKKNLGQHPKYEKNLKT